MGRTGRSWASSQACSTRASSSASPRISAARWSTSPNTRSSRDTRCVTRSYAAVAHARTHTLSLPVTHVLFIAIYVRCDEHSALDALNAPARAPVRPASAARPVHRTGESKDRFISRVSYL